MDISSEQISDKGLHYGRMTLRCIALDGFRYPMEFPVQSNLTLHHVFQLHTEGESAAPLRCAEVNLPPSSINPPLSARLYLPEEEWQFLLKFQDSYQNLTHYYTMARVPHLEEDDKKQTAQRREIKNPIMELEL